jgi:hypothetical protein
LKDLNIMANIVNPASSPESCEIDKSDLSKSLRYISPTIKAIAFGLLYTTSLPRGTDLYNHIEFLTDVCGRTLKRIEKTALEKK